MMGLEQPITELTVLDLIIIIAAVTFITSAINGK